MPTTEVPENGFKTVTDLLKHFFATFKRRTFSSREVFGYVVHHFPPGRAMDCAALCTHLNKMVDQGYIARGKIGYFKYKAPVKAAKK